MTQLHTVVRETDDSEPRLTWDLFAIAKFLLETRTVKSLLLLWLTIE